jgi:hypothetical protein
MSPWADPEKMKQVVGITDWDKKPAAELARDLHLSPEDAQTFNWRFSSGNRPIGEVLRKESASDRSTPGGSPPVDEGL